MLFLYVSVLIITIVIVLFCLMSRHPRTNLSVISDCWYPWFLCFSPDFFVNWGYKGELIWIELKSLFQLIYFWRCNPRVITLKKKKLFKENYMFKDKILLTYTCFESGRDTAKGFSSCNPISMNGTQLNFMEKEATCYVSCRPFLWQHKHTCTAWKWYIIDMMQAHSWVFGQNSEQLCSWIDKWMDG